MIEKSAKFVVTLGFLSVAFFAPPAGAVDRVELRSGTFLEGTILAQSKDEVIMQIGEGHVVLKKRTIRRIYDDIVKEMAFDRILRPDELPPWWVPTSDLFYEDWVRSVKQIPATVIESGEFKNVPYLSFRANRDYELNIFGDPDDPAAIELGVYKNWLISRSSRDRLRQFMVSYLTDLDQIRALYALRAQGGSKTVNGIRIEITPPSAPGGDGAWWVRLSNPEKLAAARVSDAELAGITTKIDGLVKTSTGGPTEWSKRDLAEASRILATEVKKDSDRVYDRTMEPARIE